MSVRSTRGIQVQVLGGFKVFIDGRQLSNDAWARNAARTLVKLLAVTPKHQLHRDQVLDLLWPELAPDSALNSLRKALHAAREAIEPRRAGHGSSSYIQMQQGLLAFGDAVTVDADRFEALATMALESGLPEDLVSSLDAYGGSLLPEDMYEDWVAPRRETLADLRARVLRRQAEGLAARGDPERAAEVLATLLADDPLEESTHRELMRLYAAAGSRHRILRQYELLRDMLQRELGIEPDIATTAVYQEILQSSSVPALFVATNPAHVLPPILRRQPATPIVGRGRVIETLRSAAESARAAHGVAMLLSGEAGVGKTRLVADLARDLAGSGMLVLWGSSYGNDLPYGPFVDAIEALIVGLPEGERVALAARYPELAPLIPALLHEGRHDAAAGRVPSAAQEDRTRLFTAIARFLTDRAAGGSLLLVLDDLHLADPASIHLLQHIIRSDAASPWLVIGTYREGDIEPGSDLHRLIVTSTREGLVHAVSLLRLGREDADRLTSAVLDDMPADRELLDVAWRLSMGNPLFLVELVRSMRERDEIVLKDGTWRVGVRDESYVPERVSDLVAERVGRMKPHVGQALTVAAVAGMEWSYDVLHRSTSLDDMSLLDALDHALDARILEERGDGYAFRHPLMRSALYERLSVQRRKVTHGTVAEAIESVNPDAVDDLAYHYGLSPDIERAILYLERAGDRAERVYANETAERYFRRLIELLEERDRSLDSMRIRMKLSAVLHTASRYADAQAALFPALEMSRQAGDRERFVEIAGQIATFYSPLARYEEGLDFLQRTLPDLGGLPDSPVLARVYLARARLNYRLARFPEAYTAAARAVELARRGSDDGLLVESLNIESLSMRVLWGETENPSALDPRITLEHSDRISMEALSICERRGDLARMIPILSNLGVFAHRRGDLRRYAANAEQSFDLAGRVGAAGSQAFALALFGHALVLMGETERGMSLLQEAVRRARPLSAMVQRPIPFMYLAIAHIMRGAWEKAAPVLDEARTVAPADISNVQISAGLQARIALEQGNPEEARSILTQLEVDTGSPNDPEAVGRQLAQTWAETGEPREAECQLLDLVERHGRQGNHLLMAEDLVVLGHVRLLRGNTEGAIEALERARTLAAPMPYPYVEAQALYLQGLAKRACPAEAEPLLHSALMIFQRIGAEPYIHRTEAALTVLQVSTTTPE